MANIKFSDFTVGNTEGDIDFVVGYKGASNIQISPTNLLASALGNYLPLAGGTMTGTTGIHMPDNFALKAGNSQDLEIFHNGTDSSIRNFEGNLIIRNADADKDVIFQADDGSGGVTTYFRLDGSDERINVNATNGMQFMDNIKAKFGTSGDMELYHDGSHSYVKQGGTGDLYIQQFTNDGDIVFQSDDGSGGMATYFRLDGSNQRNIFSKNVGLGDNVLALFGNGNDMQLFHDSVQSQILNLTGNLRIRNFADDSDITFESDDGAGGTTTYFYLDGGGVLTRFSQRLRMDDNKAFEAGSSGDFQMVHNGTDTQLNNLTGNLQFTQLADDKDISFASDNGSGGDTIYFYLDGSLVNGTNILGATRFPDSSKIFMGTSGDMELFHSGTSSTISNATGDLNFINYADDTDIRFYNDDGSGGITEYFRVDGSQVETVVFKDFNFEDSVNAKFGSSADLRIYHNGTNSNIENFAGTLQIIQNADDGDIVFRSDDGLGGTATYFYLDGSATDGSGILGATVFPDKSKIYMGTSGDFEIFHDSNDSYIKNYTGDLYIENFANDGDIIFKSDDGSGGVETYFFLDGGDSSANPLTVFPDNSRAGFGASGDLQIYHNGSNSFISDTGVGLLVLSTNHLQVYNSAITEVMITAVENGAVNLYYDGNEKFATRSTGVRITGVSEYADNTAALAGGLTTGDVYRTGDLLKIVH